MFVGVIPCFSGSHRCAPGNHFCVVIDARRLRYSSWSDLWKGPEAFFNRIHLSQNKTHDSTSIISEHEIMYYFLMIVCFYVLCSFQSVFSITTNCTPMCRTIGEQINPWLFGTVAFFSLVVSARLSVTCKYLLIVSLPFIKPHLGTFLALTQFSNQDNWKGSCSVLRLQHTCVQQCFEKTCC